MLTIENIQRLKNKTLGNSFYYVDSIREIFDLDPKGFNIHDRRYQIDITNRTYTKTIMLNRETADWDGGKYYKLFSSKRVLYLKLDDIKDMNRFITKLIEVC
jgi:hypothetical protein